MALAATVHHVPTTSAAHCNNTLFAGARRSSFHRGTTPFTSSRPRQTCGRGDVQIMAFKFMKKLGLKKPDFLPDFGLEKRKAVLDRFFSSVDRATYDEVLAPNFELVLGGEGTTLSRQEFIQYIGKVGAAAPDFSWKAETDGSKDDAGVTLVKSQTSGALKVVVEDGQIQKLIVPSTSGGRNDPLGALAALGGEA